MKRFSSTTGCLLIALAGILFGGATSQAWAQEWDVGKIDSFRFVANGDENALVDSKGRMRVRMAKGEVVTRSKASSDGRVVILTLMFMRQGSLTVVSYNYSRLIRLQVERGRVVAKEALPYTAAFMKENEKWISEVLSVSDDGASITAIIGVLDGGRYDYPERIITLFPPGFQK